MMAGTPETFAGKNIPQNKMSIYGRNVRCNSLLLKTRELLIMVLPITYLYLIFSDRCMLDQQIFDGNIGLAVCKILFPI